MILLYLHAIVILFHSLHAFGCQKDIAIRNRRLEFQRFSYFLQNPVFENYSPENPFVRDSI
jgi:hypothetical protein